MGGRVDFSANTPIYDRRHGSLLATETAKQLARRGELRPGSRVLDIGAGTGRVAIAFAVLGYESVAMDSALPMLRELRRKAGDIRVGVVAGEGGRLPFAASSFDAVVLARVLYLMADWKTVLQEASEALKSGGCLFHEWGNGQADEDWVRIREKARTLFEDAGVENPFHPGVRSEMEVNAFISELGFSRAGEMTAGPGPAMTLRDFLSRIVGGEISYIWKVPTPVQELCLPRLTEWCEGKFTMDRPVAMPREINWQIFRKR